MASGALGSIQVPSDEEKVRRTFAQVLEQHTEELLHQLEGLGTPSGGVPPTHAHTIVGPPSRARWIGPSAAVAVVVAAVGYVELFNIFEF